VNETTPLPEPLLVVRIQLWPLAALHAQPEPAVTENEAPEDPDGSDPLPAGLIA
jgi:hypothetical protein